MQVEQIKTGHMDNYTYLIACPETKEAAIVDPGADGSLLFNMLKEKSLTLKYILATHFHFDHTNMVQYLQQTTGASVAMHEKDVPFFEHQVDTVLHDGDILEVGTQVKLKVLHTPGHTPGGVCYYGDGKLFTGDTLFVGDSGRTDFSYGDRAALGASLRKVMDQLPEDTVVMPGHDYGATPISTLLQEKHTNANAKEYRFYKPC